MKLALAMTRETWRLMTLPAWSFDWWVTQGLVSESCKFISHLQREKYVGSFNTYNSWSVWVIYACAKGVIGSYFDIRLCHRKYLGWYSKWSGVVKKVHRESIKRSLLSRSNCSHIRTSVKGLNLISGEKFVSHWLHATAGIVKK